MRPLMLALSLVLVSGCGKTGVKIPKNLLPTLRFDSFKVKSADFEQAETVFVFEVDNPYPVGLKVADLDWKLGIAGNPLLDGTREDGIDVAAGERSPIRIPVGVKYVDVFAVATDLKGKDELPWDIEGRFGLETPIGPLSLPFAESGVMPALHAPRVKLQALRLGKLDLATQTANLELDIGLESDSEKPVQFSDFGFDIKLGGESVAAGSTTIEPIEGESTVTLPIGVKLVNLGAGVVEAIQKKGEIQVGFALDSKVDTPVGPVPLKLDRSKKLKLN